MTPQTPGDAYLDAEDVDALAEGSTVLAEGSEESALAVARDWARAAVRERGRVPLLAPSRLPADLACATVTLVGSSAALAEQLPSGREAASALEALTRCTGRRPDALVALNSAAENAMLAAAAAADSGTSLVDGDACGRVFPLLEQTTFTLDGHAPLPLAMTTSTGDVVVIEHAGTRIENLVRPLVMAAGGWALVVCYPMPGDAVARGAVPGSFTRLLAAGRATGAARFAPGDRAPCAGDGSPPSNTPSMRLPEARPGSPAARAPCPHAGPASSSPRPKDCAVMSGWRPRTRSCWSWPTAPSSPSLPTRSSPCQPPTGECWESSISPPAFRSRSSPSTPTPPGTPRKASLSRPRE